MKKAILILLVLMLIPFVALAWDDCPSGEVNDPYPGECSRYIDTDDDGICDHSQPAPEDRVSDEAKTEETEEATEKETGEVDEKVVASESDNDSGNNKKGSSYYLLPILLSLTVLYIISHVLSKRNIITVVSHRKAWNLLLLITFLASGILGLLLVIRISYGIAIPLPFNILFWHVEAGIAMAAISIFHVLWHWSYFKNLFGVRR